MSERIYGKVPVAGVWRPWSIEVALESSPRDFGAVRYVRRESCDGDSRSSGGGGS